MSEKIKIITDTYNEPDGPSEGMPRADIKQIQYAGRTVLAHDQVFVGTAGEGELDLPASVADRVVSYYEQMNAEPCREPNCHGFADYVSGWQDKLYRRELKENYAATPADHLEPGKAYTIVAGPGDYNRHSVIALGDVTNLSVLGDGQPLTITATKDLVNHFAPEGGQLHELREPEGYEKQMTEQLSR